MIVTEQTTCTCVTMGKDPTQTTVLRNQFSINMRKRFRLIKSLIKTSVSENDCFGIRNFKVYGDSVGGSSFSQLDNVYPLMQSSLAYQDVAGQTEAFIAWLELVEKTILLQSTSLAGGLAWYWFSPYVSAAYRKGMSWARGNVRKAYAEAGKPEKAVGFETDQGSIRTRELDFIVQNRLKTEWARVFGALEGVSAAMNTEIRRILFDGLTFGWSPAKISTAILDRVSKIGSYRATLIARTEIIRAHHLAAIQEYRAAGIVGVMVRAEWTTARDSKVCSKCAPLDYKVTGKLWKLSEIEPLIPVHPLCRCAALPVVV